MNLEKIFIILIILVLTCLCVSAEVSSIVLNQLQNQTDIKVIVTLKKIDNASFYPNLDIRKFEGLDDISRINNVQQDTVISSLKPNEFNLKIKSRIGTWFAGYLTRDGLEKLRDDPRIRDIHPSFKVYPMLDYAALLTNASYAWNLNYTGKGQRICVIDSGVDYHNPYLGNCSQVGSGCKIVDGYDLLMGDDDPEDDHGHGTEVIGMIISNDTEFKGIAVDSEIVAMKIFNKTNGYDIEDVGLAIEDCVLDPYNANIISISLGTNETWYNSTTCLNTIKDSIDWAYSRGAFISVASGNQENLSYISYPACEPNVSSVGAVYTKDWGAFSERCTDSTTSADKITCFTNRYKDLTLVSPGALITTTQLNGPPYLINGVWGTSMAAPMVAAAAAILRQINSTFTPDQIRNILTTTGKSIYDNSTGYTFPRVDVYNATLMALRSIFLNVSNSGSSSLNVTNISSSASWVSSIYPTSFVLPTNSSQSVMVTIDLSDTMPVGSYITDLIVYSNDPDNPQKSVPLLYQRIHPGCTGISPPESGDWNVTDYTACWTNNIVTNGTINVQNDTTLFLGELTANVTGQALNLNGTVNLDNADIILS